MKLVTRRKLREEEVLALESYLGGALHQVAPRADFVSGLRDRLQYDALPAAVERSRQIRRYMPLIVAGVIGGMLLVVTGVRVLLGLLSSLGVANERAAS